MSKNPETQLGMAVFLVFSNKKNHVNHKHFCEHNKAKSLTSNFNLKLFYFRINM